MDRHFDIILAAQEKQSRFQLEAEYQRLLKTLKAAKSKKSWKQHLGEYLIELGYKFAPAPEKAL